MSQKIQPHPAKASSSLLQRLSVLVVDPDAAIANTVKQVLLQLGLGKICVEHSSTAALRIFQHEAIDFIITEFDSEKVEEEYGFVEFIRNAPASPNPQVPIILLTGRADYQEVQMARDFGITEFIAKPFTAKTLCNRIMQLIEHPRSFIITPRYAGPDRRTHEADPPPGGSRRKNSDSKNFS